MPKKSKDNFDNMFNDIVKSLGKKMGKKSVAYVKSITDWIPTNIKAIDKSLGFGFPCGALAEVYGEFKTGKTLLATYILAETIRQGGIAVLIDTEYKYNPKLAKIAGLDPSKIISIKAKYTEDVIIKIGQVIDTIREKQKDKSKKQKLTIVWDSVAATPSKKEYKLGVEKAEMAERARINSKGLRILTEKIAENNTCVIFVNQIRSKIGVMFGQNWDTVGGKAIKYHASLRVHMKGAKKIRNKKKKVIGIIGGLEVTKNDTGAIPWQQVSFELYFNKGIKPYSGYIEWLEFNDLVVKVKAKLTDEEKELRKRMSKEEKKKLKEEEKKKGKSRARYYFVDDPNKEQFSIKELDKMLEKFPILDKINLIDDEYEKYFIYSEDDDENNNLEEKLN